MPGKPPEDGHISARELGRKTGLRKALGPVLRMADTTPVLSHHYVVRDLIVTGSLVLLYGDSNSGKTFFAVDLAVHIAGGRPWRGQRVNRGLCVYFACEGGSGVRNRMAAYRQREPWAASVPFTMVPQAIDLLDADASVAPMIDLVRAEEEVAGDKVAVIIIDTLARAMASGNENAGEDMGAFIANVDRLRRETGATVILIHHSGKDAAKGARGHSSLRAACDTEILIEGGDGTRTATVTKQRDLEGGQRFGFSLVPVDIGADPEDGTAITSCVVAAVDAPAKARALNGKHPPALLAGLREWRRTHPDQDHIQHDDITAICKAQGIPRQRKGETLGVLKDKCYIVPATGGYRIEL